MKVNSPTRLLTFLKERFPFSTKDIRWSVEHGRCFVNGSVERFGSKQVKQGDKIAFFPEKRPFFQREEERILYEDDTLLVYNKPPYISSIDLAQLLGVHLIHRLDRDTTGVILFAKQKPGPYEELFRKRKIKKTYHALVEGIPEKKGVFMAPIGKIKEREGAVIWGITRKGSWSKTEWVCEKAGKQWALIRCMPLTGRTHQIRVHMKALKHPILGDAKYGSRKATPGLFRPLLHASQLQFNDRNFKAPLPSDFLQMLEILKENK